MHSVCLSVVCCLTSINLTHYTADSEVSEDEIMVNKPSLVALCLPSIVARTAGY